MARVMTAAQLSRTISSFRAGRRFPARPGVAS